MKKNQNTIDYYELQQFAMEQLKMSSDKTDELLDDWYPEHGPITIEREDVLGDREGDELKFFIAFLDHHKVDEFIILPKLT